MSAGLAPAFYFSIAGTLHLRNKKSGQCANVNLQELYVLVMWGVITWYRVKIKELQILYSNHFVTEP
jgi:hypothetical protein